jgi:hypothetical protein
MATREARPTAAHLETLETARERIQRLADVRDPGLVRSLLFDVARALAGDWRPLEERLTAPDKKRCPHDSTYCDDCGALLS